MTSEKLMALEIKKKQAKEAQIQNMKDREEAACAAVRGYQKKKKPIHFNFFLLIQKKKKDKSSSKSSGTSDIFNAHDFDIDINVEEMTVKVQIN